jgi:hypothetical protein
VHSGIETGFPGHILELSTQVVEESHPAFWSIVGKEYANPAVIVVIKEASAWTKK